MTHRGIFLTATALIFATPAVAQDTAEAPAAGPRTKDDCATYLGSERSKCLAEVRQAAQQKPSGGPDKKVAKLINDTNAAAQAKAGAGDFAGAVALYDAALAQPSKDVPRQYLLVGKAAAQRRQAIAAYNGGGQPKYPGVGASNEEIRAANAANAALQGQKTAAAWPLLTAAMTTAAEAATFADGQKDKNADEAIGTELREDAALLYRLDHANVLSTGRTSADLEATWLKRWLAANTAMSGSLVAKYGVPVAAALTAKDRNAGLALADEVNTRAGSDPEGAIGYAEIVVAAKAPTGDPRRAKALAGLTAIEGSVVDNQKVRLNQAKAALSAP